MRAVELSLSSGVVPAGAERFACASPERTYIADACVDSCSPGLLTRRETDHHRDRRLIPDTFHALTVHMRRPALLLTVDGRILAANPAGERLLGNDPALSDSGLADHVLDDPDRIGQALSAWRSSGTFSSRELTFRRGGERPLRCLAEGMRIARADSWGTPLIFMRCAVPRGWTDDPAATSMSTGTSRKRTSEEARPARNAPTNEPAAHQATPPAMEIVGNIAGGIAHEFNNLLTVIQAEAEWGLQRGTDPTLRESLDSIRAASDQASKLVFRLLAYSQRQFVESEAFDLRELVEDAFPADLGLFDGSCSLSTHQCAEPLPVFADRAQIRQALRNVADNAMEAIASDGHVWIRTRRATLSKDFVARHPGSREGRFAVVEIADDGPGIPREALSRVFEPFFTTKRRTGAKGLGLSEAFGSVKRAGGYLDVQSTEAVGTTVAVYLPVAQDG